MFILQEIRFKVCKNPKIRLRTAFFLALKFLFMFSGKIVALSGKHGNQDLYDSDYKSDYSTQDLYKPEFFCHDLQKD